jgi:hypothetical protein
LACGQSLAGALTLVDSYSTVRTASKADTYTFAGTAGRQVRIVMIATSELNPYLVLKSPTGAVLAKRKRSGASVTINATLSSTGTYRVEATSYPAATRLRGLGSYTLSMTCS